MPLKINLKLDLNENANLLNAAPMTTAQVDMNKLAFCLCKGELFFKVIKKMTICLLL